MSCVHTWAERVWRQETPTAHDIKSGRGPSPHSAFNRHVIPWKSRMRSGWIKESFMVFTMTATLLYLGSIMNTVHEHSERLHGAHRNNSIRSERMLQKMSRMEADINKLCKFFRKKAFCSDPRAIGASPDLFPCSRCVEQTGGGEGSGGSHQKEAGREEVVPQLGFVSEVGRRAVGGGAEGGGEAVPPVRLQRLPEWPAAAQQGNPRHQTQEVNLPALCCCSTSTFRLISATFLAQMSLQHPS